MSGVRVSRWEAVRVALMSESGNMVLPGGIGGDAVKVYWVSGVEGGVAAGVVSVVVDRMIGVSGLVVMALMAGGVAVWSGVIEGAAIRAPLGVGLVAGAGIAGLGIMAMSPGMRRVLRVEQIVTRITRGFGLGELRRVRAAVVAAPWKLVAIGGMTAGTQGLAVCAAWLAGQSAGLGVAWYWYSLCVPLVTLATALPITPGGVGVAEQAYAWLSAPVAESARIVAFALLLRCVLVAAAAPGVALVAVGWPRTGLTRCS